MTADPCAPTAASGSDGAGSNRLGAETSPYLLQHRDNPVHWYAWGEEAFAEARRLDRPVLLSIGYAACHWCHVMAHESFESAEIAALMNELFINIKVDREERPDLDTIYQSSLALLGEQGGWPLTMFLTPGGEPFWGGTYFPPQARFGRPGFPDVLRSLHKAYSTDPDAIQKNVQALREALSKLSRNQAAADIDPALADQIAERIVREFDPFHGGVGQAPKFPQPSILKQMWRAWKRTGSDPFRSAVDLTLTKMCQGGIYDHLGGGFARYSVDERWLVPHFEKMLYDNAQLIEVLTLVWQETGNPLYEQRVRETVDWVLREMIAEEAPGGPPTGAFASTLDADSEGEEGKFYVWTEAEVDAVLGPESALFKAAYDLRPSGNWEGKTILNRSQDPTLGTIGEEAKLAELRQKLLAERAKRIRPGWDDKVLADWNGLMIAALARAAPVFDAPDWLAAAERAFTFVTERMTEHDRLRHSWRHGRLKHPATLDDYANLCDAAAALFETTGRDDYLRQASVWLKVLDSHYWDGAGGGYFFTADDTEQLIVRTKTAADNAVPAGNGTIAAVLARLYLLTGEAAYRDRAEAVIGAFAGEVNRNFFPLSTLINSSELLRNALQIVIVGDRSADDARALLQAVRRQSLPNLVLQTVPAGEALPDGHPAAGKGQTDGAATAYVCRGMTCSLPITDPPELGAAIQAG
ncbi:MAG: thioredoxin domain-containing protein [Kiloniellales bacterium]|nr:thioredoxin domain-containing protein [Kiloniellales bacterium]